MGEDRLQQKLRAYEHERESLLPPSFLNWLWNGQLVYRVNDLVQYCGRLRRYADDGSELRAGWFALKYPSPTG